MNALLVLIPVTFLLIVAATAVFFWAVNHAQFDDNDSASILPLLDADSRPDPATSDADRAQTGS